MQSKFRQQPGQCNKGRTVALRCGTPASQALCGGQMDTESAERLLPRHSIKNARTTGRVVSWAFFTLAIAGQVYAATPPLGSIPTLSTHSLKCTIPFQQYSCDPFLSAQPSVCSWHELKRKGCGNVSDHQLDCHELVGEKLTNSQSDQPGFHYQAKSSTCRSSIKLYGPTSYQRIRVGCICRNSTDHGLQCAFDITRKGCRHFSSALIVERCDKCKTLGLLIARASAKLTTKTSANGTIDKSLIVLQESGSPSSSSTRRASFPAGWEDIIGIVIIGVALVIFILAVHKVIIRCRYPWQPHLITPLRKGIYGGSPKSCECQDREHDGPSTDQPELGHDGDSANIHERPVLESSSSMTAKCSSIQPSLPRQVKAARESDIPYLPCQTVCGTMTKDGAFLQLGNVTAKYPADALPLQSHVALMVMEIKPGFRLDEEVAFSPQVSVGPHCKCQLNKLMTLCLPLEVHGEVTVLVSKTPAGFQTEWQVVPASDITIFDDYVEVKASSNCVYQAQCGCEYIITPSIEYIYFSISRKALFSDTSTLMLRCGREEVCTRPHGDFEMCHKTEEVCRIRAVPGNALRLSLKSVGPRRIKQFNTPFNINKELDCTLDEQFDMSVKPKTDKSGDDCSDKQRSEEEDHEYHWRIALEESTNASASPIDIADGFGELKVQAGQLYELEMTSSPSPDDLLCKKCHQLRDMTGVVAYLSFTVKQKNLPLRRESDFDGPLPRSSVDIVCSACKVLDYFVGPPGVPVDRRYVLHILDKLSESFEDLNMCERLAIHLEVTTTEYDFVQEFKKRYPDERCDYSLVARHIMIKWLTEDDGAKMWPTKTCVHVLCNALEEIGQTKLKKKCFTLWQHYAQLSGYSTVV